MLTKNPPRIGRTERKASSFSAATSKSPFVDARVSCILLIFDLNILHPVKYLLSCNFFFLL